MSEQFSESAPNRVRKRWLLAAASCVFLAGGFAYLRFGAGMIRGPSACALYLSNEWRNGEHIYAMNIRNQSTLPMFAVSRIIPADTSLLGSPSFLTPVTIVNAQHSIRIQDSSIVPGSHHILGFASGCTFADPALGVTDYEYGPPLASKDAVVLQPTDGTPHSTHHGMQLYAVDFGTPDGTIVTAARDGTVNYIFDESGWSCLPLQSLTGPCTEYSNVVVIRHTDGTEALYVHLLRHSASVRVGQHVNRGEPIAKSGRTGTRGPHLHFSIHTLDTTTGDNRTVPFRMDFFGHKYNNNSSLMVETRVVQ